MTKRNTTSKSVITLRPAYRTKNSGLGRVKGRGMTPDERREFLAGKRPPNTKTTQRIVHVLKAQ